MWQLLAELALAVHWFNPLAWLCVRRFRVERELAADDAVISAGARPSAYAEDLLAIAGVSCGTPSGVLGMGESSRLVARVAAILATGRARSPLGPVWTSVVVTCSVASVFAIACAAPTANSIASSQLPASRSATAAAAIAGSAIDPALQAIAEEELEHVLAEWHATTGTVLVLEPSTGEVRANAGRRRGLPANVAESTAYVTGSTIKAVTLAAALDDGSVSTHDALDCEHGSFLYAGEEMHDTHAYGTLTLAQMLAVSSNIGFTKIFDRVGGARLVHELRALHFGEAPGWVPEHIEDHSREGALVAIGEGLTATPLQVAAAYATLANDGAYVEPTLRARSAPAPREQVMKPQTARAVVAMLDEAVNGDQATGTLARMAGTRVAGKTGTAIWDAPEGGQARYASFVGIVPEEAPRYVILVGVEQPRDNGAGGTVAAPVFARVATRAFSVR
jgi:cell division protein FtsI (penicillin-binding protein 3)